MYTCSERLVIRHTIYLDSGNDTEVFVNRCWKETYHEETREYQ